MAIMAVPASPSAFVAMRFRAALRAPRAKSRASSVGGQIPAAGIRVAHELPSAASRAVKARSRAAMRLSGRGLSEGSSMR